MTINSSTKSPERQTRREKSPPGKRFRELTVVSRTVEEGTLGPFIVKRKQKKNAPPDGWWGFVPKLDAVSYFLRRLLSKSRLPESRASALTVELASISGTIEALAVATVPRSSNIIPTTFMSNSPR